jgi:hypothetical protein
MKSCHPARVRCLVKASRCDSTWVSRALVELNFREVVMHKRFLGMLELVNEICHFHSAARVRWGV